MPFTKTYPLEARLDETLVLPSLEDYKRLEIQLVVPKANSIHVAFQGQKRGAGSEWVGLPMRDKNRKDKQMAIADGAFSVSLTNWKKARFVVTRMHQPTGPGSIKVTLLTHKDLGLEEPDIADSPSKSPKSLASPTKSPKSLAPRSEGSREGGVQVLAEKSFVDFNGLLRPRLGATYTYKNVKGMISTSFVLTLPAGARSKVIFEGSLDGSSWFPLALWCQEAKAYLSESDQGGIFEGAIGNLREWRVQLAAFEPADPSALKDGLIFGRMTSHSSHCCSSNKREPKWEIATGAHPYLKGVVLHGSRVLRDDPLPIVSSPTLCLPSEALTLKVFSSSEEDAKEKSGGYLLRLRGLSKEWTPIEEEILLDGQAEVITRQAFLRLQDARIRKVGKDGASNVGTIQIKSGEDVLSQILPGEGQAFSTLFSVPKGSKAILRALHLGSGGDESMTYRLYSRHSHIDGCFGPVCLEETFKEVIHEQTIPYEVQPVFEERTDIWMRAEIDGRGHVRPAQVRMEMIVQKV